MEGIGKTADVFVLLYFITGVVLGELSFADHELCNHVPPGRPHHQEVFYDVHIEPEHIVKRRSVDQPLQIHLHYDHSLNRLPAVEADLLKHSVLEAVHFWESTLSVRATGGPIKMRRQCTTNTVVYNDQRAYCADGCSLVTVCGDITIPEEHLDGCMYWSNVTRQFLHEENAGPGVQGKDFVLYVAAIQTQRCTLGNTVAYASYCQQERALDRPVAGYFNICPATIAQTYEESGSRDQLLSTMKHEILHALGFTSGLFAFYRDENGDPFTPRQSISNRPSYNTTLELYQWSDRVVRQVTRPEWKLPWGKTTKTVNMIVTPRVQEEVRRHFNCSELEGAELEDQGIKGTVLTHWEKRIFEDEMMTGTYSQMTYLSRITLAMMEDTGWYKVNYEKAENYEWGKDLGCDFVFKSCFEWISSRKLRGESIYPYCTDVKAGDLWTDCTKKHDSVALCNLMEYQTPLPVQYQYFTKIDGFPDAVSSHFGGSVPIADFCPYLQKFSWTKDDKKQRGSSCVDPANNVAPAENYFGEIYGPTSRCFNHGSKWFLSYGTVRSSPQHSGSGCYEVNCSAETGLSVFVAGAMHRCFREGQVIDVCYNSDRFYHRGHLICPACNLICKDMGVECPPDQEPLPDQVVTCQACTSLPTVLSIALALVLSLST